VSREKQFASDTQQARTTRGELRTCKPENHTCLLQEKVTSSLSIIMANQSPPHYLSGRSYLSGLQLVTFANHRSLKINGPSRVWNGPVYWSWIVGWFGFRLFFGKKLGPSHLRGSGLRRSKQTKMSTKLGRSDGSKGVVNRSGNHRGDGARAPRNGHTQTSA